MRPLVRGGIQSLRKTVEDMLSEHQPSANEENEYIEEHGFEEL